MSDREAEDEQYPTRFQKGYAMGVREGKREALELCLKWFTDDHYHLTWEGMKSRIEQELQNKDNQGGQAE